MITQHDLELFTLEGFLRDVFDEVSDHYVPAGEGIYMVYVNGSRQRDSLLQELRDQQILGIVDSYPTNPETMCYELRFTQPPRIVYGDESAEIARLRAVGRALADEAVQWDDHSQGWRCIGCGAFHDVFEQVVHAEHCRVLVFEAKEGGE